MLTVIGEALVDVVRRPGEPERPYVGGSPLNVAVGLARLGHSTRFTGRYGRDDYGSMIAKHLRENDVDDAAIVDDHPTSVAIANLSPDGSAQYEFELVWDLPGLGERLAGASTLTHTGSIATMLEPGAAQVIDAVRAARENSTVTYDPNCRPTIIDDAAHARHAAEAFVALADVVKASDEDLEWLYPGVDPLDSAREWLKLGPAIVVVTRGSTGPWAVCAAGEVSAPAAQVDVVDTVGAGDSFMAALLSAIVDRGLDGAAQREKLRAVTVQTLTEMLTECSRAAGITVSRAGANPPTRDELEAN